jgi:hypothetical protein
MRVRESHSDLAAAVLEAKDLFHVRQPGHVHRPVDPRFHDQSDPFRGSWPNDESWSLVKQTTSQRPTPRSRRNKDPPGSTVSGTSGTDWANDGNRFSKTTTS